MKTKNTFLTFLACITLLCMGCKKQLIEKLTDGVNFNLNMNTYFQNQLEIQVFNANYQNSSTVPNPKITVSGPDASLVYDLNGTREIIMSNQFARMVISPGQPLNASHPAEFTVKAEAEGFMPIERKFIINSTDDFSAAMFAMVEINNTPKGIIASKSDLLILNGDGSLASNKTVRSVTDNGAGFTAALTVPQGTKAIDHNNKPLQGSLEINVMQFNPNESAALNAEPALHATAQATERNGKFAEEALDVLGFADITVRSAGKEAAAFSQPVQLDFSLPLGVTSRVTGEIIQSGSPVEVFQKDAAGILHAVGTTTLVQSNGFLKASIKLSSTNGVVIASSEANNNVIGAAAVCASNFFIEFSRSNADINTLHYIEVQNASTNAVLASASSVAVVNRGRFIFPALPLNTTVKVVVYQYEVPPTTAGWPNNRVVATSTNISSCGTTNARPLVVAVNPQRVTNNPLFVFNLDTYCTASRTVYFHDGRTQFRPQGSTGPWIDLGYAVRVGRNATQTVRTVPGENSGYSTLTTDRLVLNGTYRFQTLVSGPRRNTSVIVTKVYSRGNVVRPSEYTLATRPNATYPGGVYRYSKKEFWIAPATACQDFGY